jgi:amino acid transporter
MKFKKDISKVHLLFTAIGGIIGSGWLLGPLYTAQAAGPAAILAWLLGGLLMIVVALTFAELATMFPVAGGMVRFAQFSHGTFASFNMAWISWLAAVMVAPIETMAAIQYSSNYFPWLIHTVHTTKMLTPLGFSIAAMLMLFMCWLNVFGAKVFAKSNSVIVSWKLTIPVIAAIILLSHKFSPGNFYHFGGFAPLGFKGILTALPTAGVIFSFIGYSPAIQLAAEAKNPQKAIPFAILGAISLAIVLYVVIEIAFIGAISPSALNHGWKNLIYPGDSGPIAGIIAALGIGWFLKVIYFDALISPVGTAYIYTASTSRVNFAMSQNGYMPTLMQKLNRRGVPVLAIIVNYIVGLIFFLPFPGWQSMVSFIVSAFVLAYAIGPLSCAALRKTMPDVERPFKLPAYTMMCLAAFFICNLIIYWTGWNVVWKMLVTVLIGYLWLAYQAHKNKDMDIDLKHGLWIIPYLIGLGVISYLGSFGGGDKIIPFGWDFLVVGILSVLIYYYALYSAKEGELAKSA